MACTELTYLKRAKREPRKPTKDDLRMMLISSMTTPELVMFMAGGPFPDRLMEAALQIERGEP